MCYKKLKGDFVQMEANGKLQVGEATLLDKNQPKEDTQRHRGDFRDILAERERRRNEDCSCAHVRRRRNKGVPNTASIGPNPAHSITTVNIVGD